jgi:hypothetical protein
MMDREIILTSKKLLEGIIADMSVSAVIADMQIVFLSTLLI